MKSWIKLSLLKAGWAPMSVFLLSLLLGNVFQAYLLIPGLDKPVHLGGGMAITYFFSTSIFHSQRQFGAISRDRQLCCALMLSFFVAVAWECVELIGDMSFNSKLNHGFTDTLLDILFGLLGSLIVLFFRADGARVSHKASNAALCDGHVRRIG
jgi:prepilin-type processing-associated H-X9-DG protein